MKFEVMCIDQQGKVDFTTEERFMSCIQFNEKICSSNIKTIEQEHNSFEDIDKSLKWRIQKLDTSKVIGDYFTSAFIILVEGEEDILENLRKKLLEHLRKQGFNHLKILTDQVSQSIAVKIYPHINELESLLRRYIVKFFITKIGLNWIETTVSNKPKEKIKMRFDNEKIFTKSNIINADIELIDFDELGEIIYQQKTAFSKPEEIIKRIENAESLEDLKILMQGNYSKYFKDYFERKDFESKWKRCYEIRNKVAHNYLFTKQDLDDAFKLIKELKIIINNADDKIDEAVFSIAEKEALKIAIDESMMNTQIIDDADKNSNEMKDEGDINDQNFISKKNIFYPQKISEEEVIEQLYKTEEEFKNSGRDFVGLGLFVKEILQSKGYTASSSYVVIDILKDKGKVEIYEVKNPYGMIPTKAIRTIN